MLNYQHSFSFKMVSRNLRMMTGRAGKSYFLWQQENGAI